MPSLGKLLGSRSRDASGWVQTRLEEMQTWNGRASHLQKRDLKNQDLSEGEIAVVLPIQ